MLSDVFYWLLNMSISASIAGSIIYLLGKISKIPRRIIKTLWIVPFFRMWIPIGMNSRYSIMTLISKFTARTVVIYRGVTDFSMTNHIMAAETYFPVAYVTDKLEKVFQIAAYVWIVIASAIILAVFIVYAVTKSELKDACHFYSNIYISDKIASPATYGILREKIMLPKIYETDELKFILMHENVHIKRKDNLWRMIAVITAAIHWFNPMSWLFLKTFLANLELACDEAVLSKCGEAEKKNYATVLLNCAESKNLYASAFGGAKVRVRIGRILSYKKLSVFSIICFIALSIIIGYALLTNAV